MCAWPGRFDSRTLVWRLALPLRRPADGSAARLSSPKSDLAETTDRRALALGLMGSMVNFLAHGMVDASYFVIDLAFAFFLTLGIMGWLALNNSCSRANDWR